jgi:hypothetical protein
MLTLEKILKSDFIKLEHKFNKKTYTSYYSDTDHYGYYCQGKYYAWNVKEQKYDVTDLPSQSRYKKITEKEDKKEEVADTKKEDIKEDKKDTPNDTSKDINLKKEIDMLNPNVCRKFDISKTKANKIGKCVDCLFKRECDDDFTFYENLCPEMGIDKKEARLSGQCEKCIDILSCYPEDTCIMYDMFLEEAKQSGKCQGCYCDCPNSRHTVQ